MNDDKTQPQDDAAVAEELKGVPEELLDRGDQDEVAKLREELETAKQDVLYAKAETQNVRRRMEKDVADTRAYAATGFARPRVQREVERYCASPGQACSYKIGHIAWTRARQKAQAALGAKFDLRDFHDILKEGAMPLTIFERRVDERVKAKLSA